MERYGCDSLLTMHKHTKNKTKTSHEYLNHQILNHQILTSVRLMFAWSCPNTVYVQLCPKVFVP